MWIPRSAPHEPHLQGTWEHLIVAHLVMQLEEFGVNEHESTLHTLAESGACLRALKENHMFHRLQKGTWYYCTKV